MRSAASGAKSAGPTSSLRTVTGQAPKVSRLDGSEPGHAARRASSPLTRMLESAPEVSQAGQPTKALSSPDQSSTDFGSPEKASFEANRPVVLVPSALANVEPRARTTGGFDLPENSTTDPRVTARLRWKRIERFAFSFCSSEIRGPASLTTSDRSKTRSARAAPTSNKVRTGPRIVDRSMTIRFGLAPSSTRKIE